MPTTKKAAAATALAVTTLFAGCGSSSSGVSAGSYVKSVCSAVGPFEKDIQSRSSALDLSTIKNPVQGKQALKEFLNAVAQDTDKAAAQLKAAGTPNVNNGQKISSTIVGAFTQLHTALTQAAQQADALPTNSPAAFKTAAQNLGNNVRSSMNSIGQGLTGLRNAELEKAAAKEPACTSLG